MVLFKGSIFFGAAFFRAAGFDGFAAFFFAVFADFAADFGLARIRADFLRVFAFFFAAFAISNLSFIAHCRATLAYRLVLRTRILSRNVVRVKQSFMLAVLLCGAAACGRLPALTPGILSQAEQKWDAHKPAAYRLVVEMSGDRVETGRFEVEVRSGKVLSLRRNGLVIAANSGQDYSMEGLFHVLAQELGLAEKPTMLGAPDGYLIYTTAKFDDATGRLIRYRRIVGGASNSIEVNVAEFAEK